MVRRLKKNVLTQLPPKRRQKISFELKQSEYTKEVDELWKEMNQSKDKNKIQQIMQRVGYHGNNNSGGDNDKYKDVRVLAGSLYTITCKAKIGPVNDYIEDLLRNDGLKFIVFCYHHDMMNGISCMLRKSKVKFIRIDGSVPTELRHAHVAQFQNDKATRVAVLSIGACGTGITLTEASLVVFAELDWTPGVLEQCEDRAHRIGQKQAVNVHYLVAKGILDEWLWSALSRKMTVITTTLNGKTQVLKMDDPTSQATVEKLSKAEAYIIPEHEDKEEEDIATFFQSQQPSGQKSLFDYFTPGSKDKQATVINETPTSLPSIKVAKRKRRKFKQILNEEELESDNEVAGAKKFKMEDNQSGVNAIQDLIGSSSDSDLSDNTEILSNNDMDSPEVTSNRQEDGESNNKQHEHRPSISTHSNIEDQFINLAENHILQEESSQSTNRNTESSFVLAKDSQDEYGYPDDDCDISYGDTQTSQEHVKVVPESQDTDDNDELMDEIHKSTSDKLQAKSDPKQSINNKQNGALETSIDEDFQTTPKYSFPSKTVAKTPKSRGRKRKLTQNTPASDTNDKIKDWSCHMCTYLNHTDLPYCEICSTPKQKTRPKRQLSGTYCTVCKGECVSEHSPSIHQKTKSPKNRISTPKRSQNELSTITPKHNSSIKSPVQTPCSSKVSHHMNHVSPHARIYRSYVGPKDPNHRKMASSGASKCLQVTPSASQTLDGAACSSPANNIKVDGSAANSANEAMVDKTMKHPKVNIKKDRNSDKINEDDQQDSDVEIKSSRLKRRNCFRIGDLDSDDNLEDNSRSAIEGKKTTAALESLSQVFDTDYNKDESQDSSESNKGHHYDSDTDVESYNADDYDANANDAATINAYDGESYAKKNQKVKQMAIKDFENSFKDTSKPIKVKAPINLTTQSQVCSTSAISYPSSKPQAIKSPAKEKIKASAFSKLVKSEGNSRKKFKFSKIKAKLKCNIPDKTARSDSDYDIENISQNNTDVETDLIQDYEDNMPGDVHHNGAKRDDIEYVIDSSIESKSNQSCVIEGKSQSGNDMSHSGNDKGVDNIAIHDTDESEHKMDVNARSLPHETKANRPLPSPTDHDPIPPKISDLNAIIAQKAATDKGDASPPPAKDLDAIIAEETAAAALVFSPGFSNASTMIGSPWVCPNCQCDNKPTYEDCDGCFEPRPKVEETPKDEGRVVNLDKVPVYPEFRYRCSRNTNRIFLYDQEGTSLESNFTVLDVESGNLDGLPDVLLHPRNLMIVQRFARLWNSLSKVYQRRIIKSGELFTNPCLFTEEIKQKAKSTFQRYRTKANVAVTAWKTAEEQNGSVRIIAKPPSKSKQKKTKNCTLSNPDSDPPRQSFTASNRQSPENTFSTIKTKQPEHNQTGKETSTTPSVSASGNEAKCLTPRTIINDLRNSSADGISNTSSDLPRPADGLTKGYLQALTTDAIPICMECNKPVNNPLLKKSTLQNSKNAWDLRFCSRDCAEASFMKTSREYAVKEVFQAERGVCQMCKFDCEHLRLTLSDSASLKERATTIDSSIYKVLSVSEKQAMIKRPQIKGKFYQVDHIVPVMEGGGWADLTNLRTLCTVCHKRVTSEQLKNRSKTKAARNTKHITTFFKSFSNQS
ncbi:unnamed protein product [Owenia fusiformis]|uniref:Uncharacterized protein n=1 Tax=Owenia fusiformis TaxID=6347 RepID=A0A8J1U6Z6_OWEFU|nr:unnamed protein product [Owenia fusiformis]